MYIDLMSRVTLISGDGAALPLIMPLVVLQIFTQRCSAVPWSGICIQCDRKCLGPFDEKLKTRISVDETISSHVQNGHMVEAHSSRTLVGPLFDNCWFIKCI